jgi:hypothetical protein
MRTASHAIQPERRMLAAISALNLRRAPRHPLAKQAAKRVGLLERFDRAIARARQRDLERYLAGSKDVFELEQRIRNLERTRYF